MTTPISTTLNLNLASATPRSAEATKTENPNEKPLSPETKQALQRWYPKQDDWYGLFPQANKNKLSDFLAHPVKNLGVVIGIGITAIEGLILGLLLFGLTKAKDIAKNATAETKANIKTIKVGAMLHSAVVLFFGGLTLADYLLQKNLNKDTLQGIQTLGEQATRNDWINYKKTHPELKHA